MVEADIVPSVIGATSRDDEPVLRVLFTIVRYEEIHSAILVSYLEHIFVLIIVWVGNLPAVEVYKIIQSLTLVQFLV